MINRIDLLPEEISTHIWKFVFNNTIDSLIKNKEVRDEIGMDYTDTRCCFITKELTKKTGFWYDKLKKDYNVVLFKKELWGIPWNAQICSYEDNYINADRNKLFCSHFGFGSTQTYENKFFCNSLRNGEKYTKKDLYKQLELNNYILYNPDLDKELYINKKFMYKSWTRDRMIKELMSL